MKEVIIFGGGSGATQIYNAIKKSCHVIFFVDNNEQKWGDQIDGIPVFSPSEGLSRNFDEVYIGSLTGYNSIKMQLLQMGIPEWKINGDFLSTRVQARINFLANYARQYDGRFPHDVCVAEGGVYQGDFAAEIHKNFPDRKLFLFDTFEGFDSRDVLLEDMDHLSDAKTAHLNDTSVKAVLSKMKNKESIIVKKGWFPETTHGLESNCFGFVNLDFDLYKPTLEGLRFFYPRIVEGGVILVHDYYSEGYDGINKAVLEYEEEIGKRLYGIPIGDSCSIAFVKYEGSEYESKSVLE